MSKYLNPYTDFGFKKLFGTELNKDLLISFLNALFEKCNELPKDEIEDVTYLKLLKVISFLVMCKIHVYELDCVI
jgi:hypothetical protein